MRASVGFGLRWHTSVREETSALRDFDPVMSIRVSCDRAGRSQTSMHVRIAPKGHCLRSPAASSWAKAAMALRESQHMGETCAGPYRL